ncbi:probable disease resistance RPP8-like protein 4 [Vicia villosa]|uniref:probable disease resistance RPP8-like protein 4 n=1 Tax=Vicia villosa TaxID=3911 RepID=UPI00273C739E|nr:probable disease resistance RPP8-like protein 4 [Vicia villosa]
MDGMEMTMAPGLSVVANSLSKILIQEYTLLGSGTIRRLEWIERELRSMHGLLERVGQRRYGEQEQELNEWEEKLNEIARDAEDVIETFVIKSVKRRRWGFLYWIDKHKVGKELEKIRKRMRDISQSGMNLNTNIVSVSIETTPGGGEASSSTTTTVVVAMEKLDHILNQTIIVTDEEMMEMVERVKDEFVYLQNNIVSSNLYWSRSERGNMWLEEVKELCNYTESVAGNFILVKERRAKMGRLKKVLYLLADYASENEFKTQLKSIRTRIGDAMHRSLTYEVGGQLDMGVGLKRTTPVPDLSQESLIILFILFLIVNILLHFSPGSFLLVIFLVFIMVDERGKTSKRKSMSSLKKKKKWKRREKRRRILRFLFSTVIYFPIFYLFQFHHVLAICLFILSYSLIEVIMWSLKKKKICRGKEIIRRFPRFLFSTVIYLPVFLLFQSRPILASILFFLGYYLIEVSVWSLKKLKKGKGGEIITRFTRFLIFDVIYTPIFLLGSRYPVLTALLLILGYSLIEVIAWSVNLQTSIDRNLKVTQKLFSTIIYFPISRLSVHHPVLATFFLMLSYLLIEVIAWSRSLRRSMDKNLKCAERYLALMRAFLSDMTESAEGLNKMQSVWLGQLSVVSQNGQSLIDAYQKGKGGCLSRIKFSKDINCLLKEILDISDRKSIYGIANIQRTQQELLPLLTPISSIQEREIENEIIAEHDESSDGTPAEAASSTYQPVMGLKKKVQLIRGEKELMDALLLDANEMGELDGRSRIWVEQMRVISLEALSVLNKYDRTLNHKPILIYILKYWTRRLVNKKIDGIRNKIEDASRRRKAYGLVQIQSRVVPKVKILRARMQSSLAAKESSVVGFDDDVEVLMAELLSEEKCRCITWIVGIGGTGKTTLAKLIFEDNTVVDHFQRRVWMSLPSNCTADQFVAEIGKEAAEKTSVEEENMSTDYLLTALARTKYLIVVDCIKETSKVYLDTLNRAIPDMSTGSRVLFTTRNANVAQHAAGTIFVHPLQLLDDETSWLLFTRRLKVDISLESQTELIKIGKQIMMKCGGLPSQILKMSDLLSHKDVTREEWLSVLGGQQLNENQIQTWSETLDTINTNLPYYLRRCLFYFVLFPAEFGIPVRRLVVLWVAESLIHQAEDDEVPPELVAERYLTELIDRNMVQVAKRKRNGKVKTCRLPSALRQLWLSKANESRFLQGRRSAADSSADPKKFIIRRVADHLDKDDIWNDHIHGDSTDSTSFQSYYKDVLSFHSFDTQEGSKPGKQVGNFLKGCISSDCFLLLLVLDLERVYKPNLPKRISRLTRLRYLGLRWTYLESLPSSISKLLKLQTLDLKHTYIHTLPTSIWKMELRHLFLSETYRTRFPPQPKGNSLSDLQTLWGLFVDEETPVKGGLDKLVNITKLGLACQSMSLNQEPMIAQLETVSDWITKLEYLQSLRLKSRDEKGRPWNLQLKSFENNVYLTDMYLLGSLSSASILSQFPLSLIELTLSHSKLQEDPMIILKDFPNLQTLSLLADSYTGTTMVCKSHSFPQLHVLNIWKLEQLEEWKIEAEALPCLRQLEIRSCCHLKMLPDELKHISTLRELKLTNMPREINIETCNFPPNCQVVQTHFQ